MPTESKKKKSTAVKKTTVKKVASSKTEKPSPAAKKQPATAKGENTVPAAPEKAAPAAAKKPPTSLKKAVVAAKSERQQVMARKKLVYEKNADNYDKIIFYRGTGTFWIAGGHSAVILKELIYPEVKLRTAIHEDTDHDYTFKEGVVLVGKMEHQEQKLQQSELLELPPKMTKDYIVYTLKKALTPEQFETMKNEKEIQREKVKKKVMNVDPLPGLTTKLEELYAAAFNANKKQNLSHGDFQEYVTKPMLLYARAAYRTIVKVNRGEIEVSDGLEKIRDYLNEISVSIVEIVALSVMEEKRYANLTYLLTSAITKVESEMEKCKKNTTKE